MYIFRDQNLHICNLRNPKDKTLFHFENYFVKTNLPNSRGKISRSIISSFNDPKLNLVEEKMFLSNLLLSCGENLFTESEVKKLSLRLPYIFRQKEFSTNSYGQKMITNKYDTERSTVSTSRILFSQELIPLKLADKEDAIFDAYNKWKENFTLSSPCNTEKLKYSLYKFKNEFGIYGIKLFHNEDTTHEEVIALITAFELIPKPVIGVLKDRLRGGIHLSLSEFQALGEYNPTSKEICLGKAKHFSTRGYLELILHEIGHTYEEKFINDPKFIDLYNRAKGDMYKLPAIDEDRMVRQNYISSDISEFFAETFMHYILQGSTMKNGFSIFPDVSNNNRLYKEVYKYFKENVFDNHEYFGALVKNTKTFDNESFSHFGLKDILSNQVLRSRIYKHTSV